MKQEFTSAQIEVLINQLQLVFDKVQLQSIGQENTVEPLEHQGFGIEYLAEDQPSACMLRRYVVVDGVEQVLCMQGLLTLQSSASYTMSAREQEMHNDDLIRDFLSGAYNAHYWQSVFCAAIPAQVTAGNSVAVALITIDDFAALEQKYGALDTDQLICCVANQWKKFYDEGCDKVVCRLDQYTFAVGCVGAEELDLESQMRCLYENMNLVCTSTCGMLCKIPYTLSIACAATGEVCNPSWAELQILCEARLHSLSYTGGNGVAYAELH